MNKFFTFGCGQGATKAMLHCIEAGTLNREDCCIVNSTQKDIPEEYRETSIIISDDPDAGCGKVRNVAKKLMLNYIKNNPNVIQGILESKDYQYVNIMATTEGASGSGASVILAKFIESQLELPVIITLISGFESDTRGLQNTIEYFKDLNGGDFVVRTVSNKKYLEKTNNTFTAEKMANEDISTAFKIISASDIKDSEQNIDDTDHYKLITNPGMMFVTEVSIDRKLKNPAQFEQLISDAIDYNGSLDFEPSATKIGVFMNISDDKLAIIDTNFTTIKKKLCGSGTVDEFFIHRQYDGNAEYVRIVATGMNLPKEELMDIYAKYQTTKATSSKKDDFFDSISDMDTTSVSEAKAKKDSNDFFSQFDTNDTEEDDVVLKRTSKRRFAQTASPVNSNVSGGYEKKKGFTAQKSDEKKPYSEDNLNKF